MKHYGDITKIHGWDVPIVDVIVGGSPCQDLSTAGKRAGLDGERSGLFMDQIRIIKEMREYDRIHNGRTNELCRPRFMVWENVEGAFSSNGGEDFRIVLEETAKVADGNTSIPRLPQGSNWSNAGVILGDGWSIAWRLHDAQFWGVPQRRKRISLVADFGGQYAPPILFECKGLSRDIDESREEREGASSSIRECVKKPSRESISFQERGGCEGGGKGILIQYEKVGTLSTLNNQSVFCIDTSHADDVIPSLQERDYKGGKNILCIDMDNERRRGIKISDECSFTLSARAGTGGNNVPAIFTQDAYDKYTANDKAATLRSSGGTYGGGSEALIVEGFDSYNLSSTGDLCKTLQVGGDEPMVKENDNRIRKLTPMECERLQGFPDRWTDIGEWEDSKGKKHKSSDAPRYKALGNSIALPFWDWMAGRMVKYLNTDNPTMASLFDGIGGFPLVYQKHGCKPIWASEIEEFPIAVTKLRFPEEKP